jgi:glycerophosphoryl diester phosphodiesterase
MVLPARVTRMSITPDSLFAHRGLHDDSKPKNSLSAIVAAADAGYGIEFDIHLSSDGVPFVSHDPDTMHDTGIRLQIAETRSEALRELAFISNGEGLATLDDVVREVDPVVPLLVEIKQTKRVRATVDAVALRLHGRERTAALQSFQPAMVWAAKRRHSAFAVGQLGEAADAGMPVWERWYWQTLPTNAWNRPDFLAMHLSVLTAPHVNFWRERLHCPLLAWTVVDDADVAHCHSANAGLIFEQVRP